MGRLGAIQTATYSDAARRRPAIRLTCSRICRGPRPRGLLCCWSAPGRNSFSAVPSLGKERRAPYRAAPNVQTRGCLSGDLASNQTPARAKDTSAAEFSTGRRVRSNPRGVAACWSGDVTENIGAAECTGGSREASGANSSHKAKTLY